LFPFSHAHGLLAMIWYVPWEVCVIFDIVNESIIMLAGLLRVL
jgi:hypothetical protein